MRALLSAFLLGLLITLARAQCPGVTTPQTPFAKEPLLVSTTAVPLTAAIYKPAGVIPTMAMVSVEGGAIRYDVVGTPTSTSGHPISPLQTFPICGLDSIAAFKAVRQSQDAQLFVTYYRSK